MGHYDNCDDKDNVPVFSTNTNGFKIQSLQKTVEQLQIRIEALEQRLNYDTKSERTKRSKRSKKIDQPN